MTVVCQQYRVPLTDIHWKLVSQFDKPPHHIAVIQLDF